MSNTPSEPQAPNSNPQQPELTNEQIAVNAYIESANRWRGIAMLAGHFFFASSMIALLLFAQVPLAVLFAVWTFICYFLAFALTGTIALIDVTECLNTLATVFVAAREQYEASLKSGSAKASDGREEQYSTFYQSFLKDVH
jgi:hypothetical protein